jgi:hypothetical protein
MAMNDLFKKMRHAAPSVILGLDPRMTEREMLYDNGEAYLMNQERKP